MQSLEEIILGHLLIQPELHKNIDKDFFKGPKQRLLFREIQKGNADIALIAEKINIKGIGSYLNGLLDGIAKTDSKNLPKYINEVKKKRLESVILKKIEKKARAGNLSIDEIEPDLLQYRVLSTPQLDISNSLKKGSELQILEMQVEWLIDKLIPERSVTLLHGRGGLGKTWICLQIGKAVNEGKEFLSLKTKNRPVVYIDYENSLPLLIERVRKLDIKDVLFWHLSAELKPPKLDSKDYVLFKELPHESLLIFDTLRAAHDGDENSSKDMSFVLERLKELRELGFTILLNHHTGKADERIYKGSTAISDQADHVLSLHKVRRSTFEEIDDDLELGPGDFFRFGTREKTRYEPYHLFLTFDPEAGGFLLADDPDQENLDAIAEFIKTADHTLNQTEIFNWAKAELEIKKKIKLSSLLKKGEKLKLWISKKEGYRRLYESL